MISRTSETYIIKEEYKFPSKALCKWLLNCLLLCSLQNSYLLFSRTTMNGIIWFGLISIKKKKHGSVLYVTAKYLSHLGDAGYTCQLNKENVHLSYPSLFASRPSNANLQQYSFPNKSSHPIWMLNNVVTRLHGHWLRSMPKL
jgi:hypothetical protein